MTGNSSTPLLQSREGGYVCDRHSGRCLRTLTASESESYDSCQQRCTSYQSTGQLRRIHKDLDELEHHGFLIQSYMKTTVQTDDHAMAPAIIVNAKHGTDVYDIYVVAVHGSPMTPFITKNTTSQIPFSVSVVDSILYDMRKPPESICDRETSYIQNRKMTRKILLAAAGMYGLQLPPGYNSRTQLCRLVAYHEDMPDLR
jgi:hypothetical protein